MSCAPSTTDAAGVVVATVRPRTPAATAGLQPGDRLLAINGRPLRDAIDFHFESGDLRLTLKLVRHGKEQSAVLQRRGADWGLTLEPPKPSEISTCANKCVFCFIHQLPRGMRKSLYVKDDDFRLSFLHGNYVTLTDLDEEELSRIEEQRLSPLYVSVHATDPELRHRLLGQPKAKRDLMPVMERLARAGIRMHAQIVLCPDWNDGAQLDRSVHDLARLHPAVASTAVVPVGLTRHRERLPQLRTLTDDEARTLVHAIEKWQAAFSATLDTRFVWASDELYLQAGLPLPRAAAYEGFSIAEDGVGLVRLFHDGWQRAVRRAPSQLETPRTVTVVTGQMFAPSMQALLDALTVDKLRVSLAPIANDWFGRGIGVAGLLTGHDIEAQLAGRDLGDRVLVPAVAVRDGAGVFLDDLSPEDLGRALGTPVIAVEPTPAALLRALVGE